MSNFKPPVPQAGPQTDFLRLGPDVPLVFYGGAAGGGKSWAILLDCLKYIDCPDFYAVYFRQNMKQMERTLWPNAKSMFFPFLIHHSGPNKGRFKGKAQIRERDKMIIFPSGARAEFTFLDSNTVELNWQGAELTAAYFDEFSHYDQYSFNYIRTRMRSKSKYQSFIRCTLNPAPTHFVLNYLNRYIGADGLARKDLSGKLSYFIFDKGELVTSWSYEDLKERYPKLNPRVYTFIPSSLEDNEAMSASNPTYAEDLMANDPANAELLLKGNWLYTPAANGFFERSTVQVVDKEPLGCTYVRCWDKASSKPAKEGGDSKQMDPDYTASIMFAKDKDNNIYVLGNYIRDKADQQIARIREKPGPRDLHIEKQSIFDGTDVPVCLPCDPGAAGQVEHIESAKKLQALGFTVIRDNLPSNKSKKSRFEPFAAACFVGNVYWVKSSFDPQVWTYMLLELENFDGDKNNGYHDDIVDCFSSAFSAVQKAVVYKAPPVFDINAPTMYANHMGSCAIGRSF